MAAATAQIERWPANASKDYITAREDLLKAEWSLRDQNERVAAMRRALPPGAAMADYTFTEASDDGETKQTTLADLAADGRSVVIYHLMFPEDADEACSMCGLVIDGLDGVTKHLAQHVNFAVVGKAALPKLRDYARRRGWDHVRLLSSHGSSFNADMHVERPAWTPDADQMPGLSVFRKDGEGVVRHVYSGTAHFDKKTERGLDAISPVWMLLDVIPEGRGNWYAENDYI